MSNEDLYTHSSYGFHVDSQEQLNRLLDEADKVEREEIKAGYQRNAYRANRWPRRVERGTKHMRMPCTT